MKPFSHPYYWGAFVVCGHGGAVTAPPTAAQLRARKAQILSDARMEVRDGANRERGPLHSISPFLVASFPSLPTPSPCPSPPPSVMSQVLAI